MLKKQRFLCFLIFFGLMFFISLPVFSSEMTMPPLTRDFPDPKTDRMCAEAADPDAAPDKIHINCRLDYGSFSTEKIAEKPTAGKEIRIVAYNLERGMKFDEQLKLIQNHPDFKGSDILLLSEADRGCSRTNYRYVAKDLAQALGMNFVFGVEYIELPRKSAKPVDANETMCEHGNAVLTRFPFKGVEQIRHKESTNWYIPPGPERDKGQPRLGGVMAIAADIDVDGAPLRVYEVHIDSGISSNTMRAGQAAELVEHAKEVKYPVVMGGDFNTFTYINDLKKKDGDSPSDSTPPVMLKAGFVDAHSAIPPEKRGTTKKEYGMRFTIDLMFVRAAKVIESGICPIKTCESLSDHLPVWTKIKLP